MKPSLLPPSHPATNSQSLANIAATSVMEQLGHTVLSEPHPLRPTALHSGLSTHQPPQPKINRVLLRAVLKEALDLLDDTSIDFAQL